MNNEFFRKIYFDNFEGKILIIGLITAIGFLLAISFSRIVYPFDTGPHEAGILPELTLII